MGPVAIKPPDPQGEFCPYLDLQSKQCTIHPRRPLICRLYGVQESMPCPHGCKPEPRYLTNEEAQEITQESIRIGAEA